MFPLSVEQEEIDAQDGRQAMNVHCQPEEQNCFLAHYVLMVDLWILNNIKKFKKELVRVGI